jgi:hypothetical protein
VPQQITAIPFESPWLLAGTDRLWVIGSKGVGYYKEGSLFVYPEIKTLGDISRPFLYNGLPSLIENRPDRLALMVFRDNAWQEELHQLMSGQSSVDKGSPDAHRMVLVRVFEIRRQPILQGGIEL